MGSCSAAWAIHLYFVRVAGPIPTSTFLSLNRLGKFPDIIDISKSDAGMMPGKKTKFDQCSLSLSSMSCKTKGLEVGAAKIESCSCCWNLAKVHRWSCLNWRELGFPFPEFSLRLWQWKAKPKRSMLRYLKVWDLASALGKQFYYLNVLGSDEVEKNPARSVLGIVFETPPSSANDRGFLVFLLVLRRQSWGVMILWRSFFFG